MKYIINLKQENNKHGFKLRIYIYNETQILSPPKLVLLQTIAVEYLGHIIIEHV